MNQIFFTFKKIIQTHKKKTHTQKRTPEFPLRSTSTKKKKLKSLHQKYWNLLTTILGCCLPIWKIYLEFVIYTWSWKSRNTLIFPSSHDIKFYWCIRLSSGLHDSTLLHCYWMLSQINHTWTVFKIYASRGVKLFNIFLL